MPGLCAARIPRTRAYKGLLIVFVQIPGFSQNKSSAAGAPRGQRAPASPVILDPVQVRISSHLWFFQLAFHGVLALLCLWVFLPWLGRGWYWPAGLLLAWSAIALSGIFIWRGRAACAGMLSVGNNGWCWQDERGKIQLIVAGDVTVWSMIIVLRFQETRTGRRRNVILLHDNVAAEDLRRLRVWLRTQLKHNGDSV